MQLPEFIKRALGFFDSTESRLAKLEATKADEDDGDGDCPDCDGSGKVDGNDCMTCGGSGKAKDGMKKAQARVIELQGQLSALQGQGTAKDSEIAQLKSDLEAAKKKANEVIAGQGLSPEQLPSSEPNAKTAGAPETPWGKYNRLLTEDPRAAGQFWQESADKILGSRPK